MSGFLIKDAELRGRRMDVRVSERQITALGSLMPKPGEDIVAARGGALLPGLTDHHLHLLAWAAADLSIQCGPPDVRNRHDLAAAIAAAPTDLEGWVRGIGYIESTAGDLDRHALDALGDHRPLRIQHRSGALWMLNTAATNALGLADMPDAAIARDSDGRPTGRVWRGDHLMRRASRSPDLTGIGERLAAWGVTAVTDATPDTSPAGLAEQVLQRVEYLGPTGTGPLKIVIRDDDLPGLDDLTTMIRDARPRCVAVHCVSREALILLLAALDETTAYDGDRIEHAAIVPESCIERIRHHRLAVVTQPGFIAARGADYVRDVPVDERDDLYRYRSLLQAGVRTFPSSDAPYGPADPWQIIAAAHDRRCADGVVAPSERVSTATVLAGFLTPFGLPNSATRLAVGSPADLVLLDSPLKAVLHKPNAEHVRLTAIDGRIAYARE